MKNLLIFATILLISCSEKKKNYDLSISNHNYQLDVKSGEFKIDWYNEYKDTITFSEEEKHDINELIYDYKIDEIKGEKLVFGKANLIMPNFNDKFTLKIGSKIKSEISISSQVTLEKSILNSSEKNVFNFKTELFKILDQNKDFIRNIDSVKVANKKVRRLFL